MALQASKKFGQNPAIATPASISPYPGYPMPDQHSVPQSPASLKPLLECTRLASPSPIHLPGLSILLISSGPCFSIIPQLTGSPLWVPNIPFFPELGLDSPALTSNSGVKELGDAR